ncbi:MAG: glycosyltransferase [Acidobacteria bacterium]|nr:glycosyltransferase [Acidobacteriota bacterium]
MIVCLNLARSLSSQGVEVDLLCFLPSKEILERHRSELEQVYRRIFFVERDLERQYIGTLLLALASNKSYFLLKFQDPKMSTLLQRILLVETYERTILEGAFLAAYRTVLEEYPQAAGRVTLRLHNVESEIFERLARKERRLLYRWLLRREAFCFREHELEEVSRGDVRAITHRDASLLEELTGREFSVMGPTIDLNANCPGSSGELEALSLVCVGNMKWLPNIRGIQWFLDEVWPAVRQEFPGVRFYAIGKNPPEELRRREADGVVVTGYVDDVRPYFRRAHVFVVPILEGSGIRIKIIMALAMGKEIISTSVGAEGITFDGLNIADTPEEWIEGLRGLLALPPRNRWDAVEYARAHHSWQLSFD